MRKHAAIAACSMLVFANLATPASAADNDTITINGTLTDSCTVLSTADGTMTVASNGLSMSTEESGGSAATLSVSAVGTPPQVDFGVPDLSTSPVGYTPGDATTEIKFSSAEATDQTSYTSSASSSLLDGLSATFTVHGKVTDSAGLPSGNYAVTTLATCSTPV